MKRNYMAILFAPDGEYVTDFRNNTEKSKVWEAVADMGSKWIFYPIVFVATNTVIVDTPDGLEQLKGKRIKTVKKLLAKADQNELCKAINNGWPITDIIK